MTVRLYAQRAHPVDCPVCTDGLVSLATVGPHGTGSGHPQWQVSRLARVIPCPQCVDGGPLVAVLERGVVSAPVGGGAA